MIIDGMEQEEDVRFDGKEQLEVVRIGAVGGCDGMDKGEDARTDGTEPEEDVGIA